MAATLLAAAPVFVHAAKAAEAKSDKLCTVNLDGKTSLITGKVREVGDDGFSQYMIVDDNETGCRVVIFVDADAMPCPYGENVSIGLKLRKADSDNVNYFDGGGPEPYFCSTEAKD